MAKEFRRITVLAGKHESGCYNWSPFVNKLQARLRFANVSYDIKGCSLSQAPKGKIPYISLAEEPSANGNQPESPSLLGDTNLITKHLIDTGDFHDLNEALDPVQLAQDLAVRALLEDKIYFMQTRERWMVNENFYKMRDEGPLSAIPYPIRILVGILAHRKNSQTLNGQGVARYSEDELSVLRSEAWAAIDGLISAKRPKARRSTVNSGSPFWALGGELPTELDATLFGFLSAVLTCPAYGSHLLLAVLSINLSAGIPTVNPQYGAIRPSLNMRVGYMTPIFQIISNGNIDYDGQGREFYRIKGISRIAF